VLSDQIHDAPAVVALLWMCLIVEFANPGPVPSTPHECRKHSPVARRPFFARTSRAFQMFKPFEDRLHVTLATLRWRPAIMRLTSQIPASTSLTPTA
jgi:hypothetical protein